MLRSLAEVVGSNHVVTDPDVLAGRSVDHTGRYRGRASALVRPGSAEQAAEVLRVCRDAGSHVTVQGGRTSLVAGTVPEHDDVLLSTERLHALDPVDTVERRIQVGAGATLAAVQRAAGVAGLLFGVDLAARDTATVGGMASTNAGGLRTVRYGNMGEQVVGLEVALPDGSLLRRHSRVRRDNTGYDLSALFVGAEGTLGVITALELRLHPTPARRVTAICGFDDLAALIDAGRTFRDVDGIAALELIDGRAAALTGEHLGVGSPVDGDWLLLVELAADHDQTDRLADLLDGARMSSEPAVGVDVAAQQRLWQVRESLVEVLGVYGPPLKFDVSLPLSSIDEFAAEAVDLIDAHAPEALPVLFGHIGEGNLHLNVLRCQVEREEALYRPMMELIARSGGNVSSEHGVGTRKRGYLGMSREPADVAAMRTIKAALDPTGYLNAAVLFD
ncbi:MULTISPECIES: FAD-binding oxidoreductase [unclassified Mycobacterium]|uniref:FAD-binding oxidoreductase n=1 Tax=unclassified Mycobacterium TaxID=2642494 RepID=UPI0007FD79C0|nr:MULTISPECIES: FAD-binding oxidoreductase [unclassified Mycobacterium]OBG60422.1 oxidoreductase [Mycobacterium sp. E735]OBG60561.1 oxidoreductase [Mycobacterium sp. E188]OBG75208.1 oxidoreductase [Mycobacterium sp. E3305]OBG79308.1 oxidoreductase [Mycobacterium sp. E3298]OBH15507.1 oxidoreductase [Mycobacterium sp. E1715]